MAIFQRLIIYQKKSHYQLFFKKKFEFEHQEYFTSSTGVPCIGPAVQAGLLTYKQLYTLYAFSLNVTAS